MLNRVYTNIADFHVDNDEAGTPLPYKNDTSILATSVKIGTHTINNRVAYQAMEGCDGKANGAPDELTVRRYRRFAEGGPGIIWFEATAVSRESRANPRQLWMTEKNLSEFAKLADEIREISMKKNGYAPLIILQATHSGRYSKPQGKPAPIIAYNSPLLEGNFPIDSSRIISDSDIDRVGEQLVATSVLAEKAGFDGVDIKCCHRYLNSELLSAYERKGKYGGSLLNRTRLLRESVKGARAATKSDFIVSSRLNVYDGFEYPYGFGVAPNKDTDFDPTEPLWLLKELSKEGVELLNVTMGNPYFNPHVNRPYALGSYTPPEHPLTGVSRMLNGTALLAKENPNLKIISSGLSYLGAAAPGVAAAFIDGNTFDFAGFGRTIFAYPNAAKDIINGEMKKEKLCMCCSKCTELMRSGSTPGCVLRDSLYTELYRDLKKKV